MSQKCENEPNINIYIYILPNFFLCPDKKHLCFNENYNKEIAHD